MGIRWTREDIERLGLTFSGLKPASGNKISKSVTKVPENVPKPRKKRAKLEEKLQIQVATYMRMVHPDVIFRSDAAGGIRLTIGQAKLNKRMQHSKSYPDVFVAQGNSLYHGLYLELKHSRSEVYRLDGKLKADEHIREQLAMLVELMRRGYAAYFACGFDEAVGMIEYYLKIK